METKKRSGIIPRINSGVFSPTLPNKEITKTIEIDTREGKLYGYAGKDVLIKGIHGEVYPCKIDIFNATYTTTEPPSKEKIPTECRAAHRQKNLDPPKPEGPPPPSSIPPPRQDDLDNSDTQEARR